MVMAKTKITSMTSQITPRLELLASLVAARFSHFISENWSPNLDIRRQLCGAILKSCCTGYVLRSYQRIEQIKKLTNQHQWRYCPSASNPADLLSRGVPVGTLVDESSIWWRGPKWLCQWAVTWPVWSGSSSHVEHEIYQEGMEAMCMATGEPSSSLLNVIDPECYSSLKKLLAVTSHVIRFTTNCKSAEKDWPLNNSRTIKHPDTVDNGYSRSSFQPWNTAAL